MNEGKWYTVQVYLNDYRDDQGVLHEQPPFEFKDIDWQGVIQMQSNIWVKGVRIELISPGVSYELIDPFRIKKVLALQQPGKFGI